MFLKRILILICYSASVLLVGCSLKNFSDEMISYNYDYPAHIGVVQIYDFDGHTTIQLKNTQFSLPEVKQINGKTITYRLIGQSLVLPGIYEKFYIAYQGNNFLVVRRNKKIIDEKTQLEIAEPLINEKAVKKDITLLENNLIQKEVSDLLSLKEEIKQLKQQISHIKIKSEEKVLLTDNPLNRSRLIKNKKRILKKRFIAPKNKMKEQE